MGAGRKIKCKVCGVVIQSIDRHDYQKCRCGAIFIDGGDEYMRLGWPGGDRKVEEFAEFLPKDSTEKPWRIEDQVEPKKRGRKPKQ